ncbi:unnamed protein product [Macrosiphum euphorbiae]|uniref:Uncharacterized protein n=1 Tax=Macrosiphum euphorbiae TaxID=13131 RepID=A0AAV0XZ80_9HEMI|nr:unnamed protein product [Macrosiphum euphorbiae]
MVKEVMGCTSFNYIFNKFRSGIVDSVPQSGFVSERVVKCGSIGVEHVDCNDLQEDFERVDCSRTLKPALSLTKSSKSVLR